jgi:Family of unknown function (DUF6527)
VNTIKLERVQYIPKQLSPGILYVSEKYSVAGHLCACGCGNKVITPLGPAEWSFTERGVASGPRSATGNCPAGRTTSSIKGASTGQAPGPKPK